MFEVGKRYSWKIWEGDKAGIAEYGPAEAVEVALPLVKFKTAATTVVLNIEGLEKISAQTPSKEIIIKTTSATFVSAVEQINRQPPSTLRAKPPWSRAGR